MIGGGVFITTGTLLEKVPSPLAVILCWLVYGAAALCGALAYAELGVALADNGGEYQYLSKLYHPAIGFVSAWVSLVVGFAAPTALVSGVFGLYLDNLVPGAPKDGRPLLQQTSAALLIVLLSAVNIWRMSAGTRLQNVFTVGKVALVLGFALIGLALGSPARVLEGTGHLGATLASPAFAVGLLEVSYAYTGWSASSYVAGEVEEPERVLPRALVGGTLLVTVLYCLLNMAFLAAAPVADLSGKFNVAQVAAEKLLGQAGGRALSAVILVGLVSTIGAMIVTGPRVYEAVGRDYPRLGWLATRRANGGPLAATLLQSGISLALVWAADLAQLLDYIGFTLSITAGLSVAGVFVLRARKVKASFRMPGYPVTPALFIALMLWLTVAGLMKRPVAGLWGLATVASGLVAWRFSR